jgi:fatty-acyl-CoA synthase
MSDYQLTLPAIMRRAETLFGHKEIVSRRPDKSLHSYTYADFVRRAKRLSVALKSLGVEHGDRVATLCWNHHRHLEAYFGVPAAGAVLHTLNLRLHEDDLAYIVNHAEDKVLLVDEGLVPLFEKFRGRVDLEHAVVVSEGKDVPDGLLSYEDLVASTDEGDFVYPDLNERTAAAMCYTSGTTGKPKGVLYSHRAITLHSMAFAMVDTFAIRERDVVCPVVPMFHANAWGMPFTSTLVGAKQVFTGPHLDPVSLLELFDRERVTVTGGVPTIWFSILKVLDENPGTYDLSAMRSMIVGGSAAPESLVRALKERHGLDVFQIWGMTEMTPLGSVGKLVSALDDATEDEKYKALSKQGPPVPFVEVRLRGEESLVPWDGEAMGEIEVNGPWIASSYYNSPEGADRFTEDGWLRTGDIASMDRHGYIEIRDRSKDLIKSGGEWISSVALENALMAHPAVYEASVVAVPHEKWQERPLAVVVPMEGHNVSGDELRSYLSERFAKWWLPDAVEFVEEIPKTSTGKFLKARLREQFKDYSLAAG